MPRISDNEYLIACGCHDIRHAMVWSYFNWEVKGADHITDEFCVRVVVYNGGFWNRLKTAFKLLFKESWDREVCIVLLDGDFDETDFYNWAKDVKKIAREKRSKVTKTFG